MQWCANVWNKCFVIVWLPFFKFIFPNLPRKLFLTASSIATSIVHSKLDYHNSLCYYLPEYRLNLIRNSLARTHVHVRYNVVAVRLSVVCLSSVCRLPVCLSLTFVHPTQAMEIFGNVSTTLNMLAI